jgi:trimeric autotransporter adhesin
MSNFISITEPDASYVVDSTIFDVQSGASLNLTGSSDYVILEDGAGATSISGDNDTIFGNGVSNLSVTVSGWGNSITVGDQGSVNNEGEHNTFTIGAGSVFSENGKTSTIYATQGNDIIVASNGDVVYGNSDIVSLWGGDITVNGNGNQIYDAYWGGTTLNLSGSSNTVVMSQEMGVVTSTGSLTWNRDGIVLTGSAKSNGATLTGSVLTVQLDNGNVATLGGVSSGSQIEYVDAQGTETLTTLTDTNLVHVGANMYDVTGSGATVNMSNAIFDVTGNSNSFTVTGSSNKIILEAGGGIAINGNDNILMGSGITEQLVLSNATGNSVTVGDNSYVDLQSGSNGNVITVGAKSRVLSDAGSSTTIYAMSGADRICTGVGDVVYGNNANIELWHASATVSGNSNQISDQSSAPAALNLGGSNNTVMLSDGLTVATSNGSIVDNGGQIVLAGGIDATCATLTDGILSIQLGGGNVATLSGVNSGSNIEYIDASGHATWSTLQDTGVNHLVAAMASYSSGNIGVESTLTPNAMNGSPFQGAIAVSSHA